MCESFQNQPSSATIAPGTGIDVPGRILITRNQCLSYAQAGLVIGILAIMPGFIGLLFLSRGYWMILPFAGFEVLAVAAGFYASIRHNLDVERIDIDCKTIHIYRREARCEQHASFQTCWTRVRLEIADGWYPSRLLIKSAGSQIEIGRWLTEQERYKLARRLSELI